MPSAKTRPTVSIVVAITGEKRAIGKDGGLVVRISDDLKRFKALTLGHPIIMGRKTYESIGRALPGRTNLVVTRNAGFAAPGTISCSSLDEAIEKASAEDTEIFVIGGGEIYAQALPKADRLYLTAIEGRNEGDVFFPDHSEFKKVMKREDRVDGKTQLKYSWIDLER
jgi:dihydrofolate reductase